MRSTIRFLLASWGASFRSALEYRAAFAVQALFMLANNLLFLAFWALFFARVPDVSGWTLPDVALCFGMAASAFGLATTLLGGLFDLAPAVAKGGLDTWLLRPRPVLLQGLLSRMRFSGFGDLATGPILLALSGHASPGRILVFAGGVATGALAFTAFMVACHSAAFRFGRADELANQAVNAILSFALYPPGLFGGPARILLFTLVPAGLMSWLPASLVLHPSPRDGALLLLGTGAACAASVLLWTRGLGRYESGNLTQAVGE